MRSLSSPLTSHDEEIHAFTNLTVEYLRANSHAVAFLITTTAEFSSKKPDRKYDNMTGNEAIQMLNSYVFKHFKQAAKGISNIRGFFDLFHLSESKGDWLKDGVHYEKKWYKSIMRYLVQIFCEE